MKIKEQWQGKTLISYDAILGERRIEVDKIQAKDETLLKKMGYDYIFEDEIEIKPIAYEGVEEPIVKKPRKKRSTNGKAQNNRDTRTNVGTVRGIQEDSI